MIDTLSAIAILIISIVPVLLLTVLFTPIEFYLNKPASSKIMLASLLTKRRNNN